MKKIKMVLFQQDVHKVFAETFTQSLKPENCFFSVEASSEDLSGSNVMVVMHEKLLNDLLQQNLQVAEKQTARGSDGQQYSVLINTYKIIEECIPEFRPGKKILYKIYTDVSAAVSLPLSAFILYFCINFFSQSEFWDTFFYSIVSDYDNLF